MENKRPQVNIRAESASIETWQAAAEREGLSLSEWLRRVADRAARRRPAESRRSEPAVRSGA